MNNQKERPYLIPIVRNYDVTYFRTKLFRSDLFFEVIDFEVTHFVKYHLKLP